MAMIYHVIAVLHFWRDFLKIICDLNTGKTEKFPGWVGVEAGEVEANIELSQAECLASEGAGSHRAPKEGKRKT